MAGLIEAFSDPGYNLYAMLWNANDPPNVWDNVSKTWVAWNDANWSRSAIQMFEWGVSGFYTTAVPSQITAQRLTILIYNRLGGTFAPGDQSFGNSTGLWDGTAWESGWSTASRTLTGTPGVDVLSINGSVPSAVKLGVSANTMLTGTVVAGTLSVSQMTTDLTQTVNKILFGRVVYFTSGALIGQVAAISAYDGTTKKITFFTPITSAPVPGDTFIIV